MEEESSILFEYFSESISALPQGISCSVMLCYVMWNLLTIGNLQFCYDSTIASVEANQDIPTFYNRMRKRINGNNTYKFREEKRLYQST